MPDRYPPDYGLTACIRAMHSIEVHKSVSQERIVSAVQGAPCHHIGKTLLRQCRPDEVHDDREAGSRTTHGTVTERDTGFNPARKTAR